METHRNRRPPPTHERILAIEEGRVMCPRRGIVDLEDCWTCPAYRGMSGWIEGLVCSTAPVILPFGGARELE
jgi:hypothetical protein